MFTRLAPGERLNERELADRFGISRTPMREVLQCLAAQDLLMIRPRQGVFVAHIDPAAIRQTFEVRLPLEVTVAALAAERAGREDVRQLLSLAHEFSNSTERGRAATKGQTTCSAVFGHEGADVSQDGNAGQDRRSEQDAESGRVIRLDADVDRIVRLDAAFHEALALAAGNPILRRTRESLHNICLRYWYLLLTERGGADAAQNDGTHLALAHAVASGNRKEAARLQGLHVGSFLALLPD